MDSTASSPQSNGNQKRKSKGIIGAVQQSGKFYGDILREEEAEPLTVVHCTDGATESGVYILVEVLIRCIESNVVGFFF